MCIVSAGISVGIEISSPFSLSLLAEKIPKFSGYSWIHLVEKTFVFHLRNIK